MITHPNSAREKAPEGANEYYAMLTNYVQRLSRALINRIIIASSSAA
jgi:hypothetical protein